MRGAVGRSRTPFQQMPAARHPGGVSTSSATAHAKRGIGVAEGSDSVDADDQQGGVSDGLDTDRNWSMHGNRGAQDVSFTERTEP